ncbi:MAG: hypothetical protein LBJ44_05985, partial [Propionibacteriaceae bacterium]|nr:hypothetical protein [Propionibacteriaceae bacterium]
MEETPAFKGFDADLRCRGHQYEVGRTETTDETPAACERGFHSCVNPADVLEFYPPIGPDGRPNRYALVSPGGQTDTDETKTASQALTVVKEITLTELIRLATTGHEARSATTG